ncbi:putative efflux system component YknX [bioreactor metagenome]|uniref:Putative efflux system component YknX n=1 Tax=bioreactor metagenome TaxID=1076179 RepID=A0A645EFL0_9ZZZZ
MDRFISSKEVGGISDQQLESLQTQLIAAKSRYEVSRRRLSDATVRAPMDGIINMRYVEIGSLIAPNAPLFDIVDNSDLKVICNLPESKINHIKKGQTVILTHNSLKREKFTGRINFIGVKTDRGLNYPVEIILDNNNLLRVGMYMKVNFISNTNHRGILVPRNAIVGGQRSSMVYLVKNGKAVAQEITLGEMIGDRVEVLSSLNEGNIIITSGLMNLSDGTPVKSIN